MDFNFDAEAVHAFTNGDCWNLAISLARLTGLTLVTASADEDWVHVGVLTPEGNIVDIEGVTPIDFWLDKWLEGLDGEEHYAREWNTEEFAMQCINENLNSMYDLDPTVWAEAVCKAMGEKVLA